MGLGSGLVSQMAFAKEDTANTRQTPDHFVEFVQESVQLQIPRIAVNTNRPGRRVSHRWRPGNRTVRGSINFPLVPESTAEFLELCMGGIATTGSDPVFEHAVTVDDLPTSTFQFGRPAKDGTVFPFDYVGCKVDSWSLSGDATGDGDLIRAQAELVGREEATDEDLVVAAFPSTITNWTSLETSLTLAGSAYCVDSWTLNGANNLIVHHEQCADAAGKLAVIQEAGKRDYSGTMVADFEDLTAYNRFVNGTEAELVITVGTDANLDLVITTNVRFDGTPPNVSGPDVLKQELPFVCTSGVDDNTAISMVLTNGDSAP